MLYPSIQDLTAGQDINRYMLVIGTAKSARYVTYKQNVEMENNELRKEFDKSFDDANNEKAVSTAVSKLHSGEFKIITD